MRLDGPPIFPSVSASERDRRFAMDLMHHLVVPTFVLDPAGRVLIWNKACERLTGLSAEAVVGTADHWRAFYAELRPTLADLVLESRFSEIHDYYRDFSKFGLNDFGVAVENWCDLRYAGRRAYLAIDAGPIYDDAGAVIAVVETLRDITTQREAQDALATLAALDGLTGLANRRSFDETLDAESRRCDRAGTPLALLMLDIDGFKLFNDSYGHGRGDECLRTVARTVADTVRRGIDHVARYGGEEFAVVLPDTGLAGARAMADRIRAAVEALHIPHRAAPVGSVVTVSIGGVSVPRPDPDGRRLLAAADAALYRAKRDGRNRTVVRPLALADRLRPPAVSLSDCA
jgi:diguanylate cyclase (GGDEF)-like protein/PAS domain S-box-containing protein